MAFEEDFSAFFGANDFAVAAIIDSRTVKGIFDNDYATVRGELGDVESNRPVFMCASADVANVIYGDTAKIDGTSYTVRGFHPDGTGVTMLILELA
jgi:hypothetical protein